MTKTLKKIALTMLSLVVSFAVMAQVTTSSMSGKVTEGNGTPVAGATVVAIHMPSGSQYYSMTDNAGNYRIQNMRVGGPYSVEVSILGFGSNKSEGAVLRLGDNYVYNVVLKEEAVKLNEIVVSAGVTNPILNSDKSGASMNISERQLQSLPSISRSITDFTRMTPQSNGNSFAGRDGRMNTITIDGAAFNNNFGLSTNALPGGEAQPISLDAIEEISVNIAPFDVRQSQFTGASINAVTKSGTNQYKASVYTYQRPKSFTGEKVANGITVAHAKEKSSQTYGVTVGGPIIKNKLFFFISGEYEKSTAPSNAWEPSTNGIANNDNRISRTTVADLKTVHDYLLNTYKYEAGAYQNFRNFAPKNHKIMARLDWNINKNHKFTLRYNDMKGTSDQMTNANSAPSPRGSARNSSQSIAFQNSWYGFENTVRSITGELNSTFSTKISNKFLISYTAINDKRTSDSDVFPFVDLYKDADQYMSFGYELFTYNNNVKNNTLSIVDNLSINLNKHTLTAGLSYDYMYFKNAYMREATSYYRYNYNNDTDPVTGITYANGMDAFLANATPTDFALTYGFNGSDAPGVELGFGMAAAYLQDEWQVNNKLKLTYGLRAELPIYHNKLDSPVSLGGTALNNGIINVSSDYSMELGKWPSTKVQVSPRIGFNWDVKGDRSLQVRGGTGLFTGLLPFVWFTNQPNSSGTIQSPEYMFLSTRDARTGKMNFNKTIVDNQMTFNSNFKDQVSKYPNLFPQQKGVLASGASLAEVDKDFKMPRVWRSNLAVDIELPFNMVLTLEGLFSKDINAVIQKDVNLSDRTAGNYVGSDNRPYWPGKEANLNNAKLRNAMVLTNTSKGYQSSFTAQLTKNMTKGLSGMLAYTYTVAKDVSANPGSTAASAWSSNTVVSYLNNPELSYSSFAIPHRFVGNISYRISYAKHFATTFSLFYQGSAQGRSTFAYSNDMNNDGYSSDLMYIPKSKDDIKFADIVSKGTVVMTAAQQADIFWQYVNSNSYLKERKGKYAERFGYVEPWHNRWDFKLLQDIYSNFGTDRRYTIQISWDILNVGNLINRKWGNYKYMSSSSYDRIRPLKFASRNAANEPVFQLNATSPEAFWKNNTWQTSASTSSTWGMLLGVRLIF